MNECFGHWLSQELGERGWSQADMARRTKIAPSRINDWVRDIRMPNPKSCERIASTLRVDLDEVLARAGHRSRHVDDPEMSDLIARIRRVRWTPERQRYAAALLDGMIDFDLARAERSGQ